MPGRACTIALLAVVVALAAGLRLVEPLTNGVMAAQDPYMHLAHTRSVLEDGAWPVRDYGGPLPRPHYPPGLHALFGATVAATGVERYELARFFPAALGALAALGAFALARPSLGAAGALGAAGLVATTPEIVFRGNLLQPSALDPLLVLALLLAADRAAHDAPRRLAWAALGALSLAALLAAHPWVAGVLAAALAVAFALDRALPARARVAGVALAAGVAIAGLLVLLSARWFLVPFSRVAARWQDPERLLAWPPLVDYVSALGWPLLLLAPVGFALAWRERTGAAALGLGLTLALLPFTRFDAFALWYVPHRLLLFLALGLALLGGVAVARLARLAEQATWRSARAAGAVIVATLVVAPGAAAGAQTGTWYHLYDEPEHRAAAHLRDHADVVIVGSWEGRWLVRALTDCAWTWSPAFFRDADARNETLASLEGDVRVLVDDGVHAIAAGRRGAPYDLAFLEGPGWERVFDEDGVRVYRRVASPQAS